MSHPSLNSTTPLPLSPAVNVAPDEQTVDHWQNGLLRRMVLSERKVVKLDRVAFLQLLALRDTSEQVVADLVAMFTNNGP